VRIPVPSTIPQGVVTRIAVAHLTPAKVAWRIAPYPLPKWGENPVAADLVLPELHWHGDWTPLQEAAITAAIEALTAVSEPAASAIRSSTIQPET